MVERLQKNDSARKHAFAKCFHSRYHKRNPEFVPKGILNVNSISGDRKNVTFIESDCSNDEELANHLHINELHSLFKK